MFIEEKDWKYIDQDGFDKCKDRYALRAVFVDASLVAWNELTETEQLEVYHDEREDPWMPIEDFPYFIVDSIDYSRYYGRGHLTRLWDEIQSAKDIYWDKTHTKGGTKK